MEPATGPAEGQPPGGAGPPAPPTTGEPGGGGINPGDRAHPISVRLEDLLLGDLGNARVDARLLTAILARDGKIGNWLRDRGVTPREVERDFPNSDW